MSRITGKPVPEIDRQKIKVLEEETQKLDVFIVLKGAHSLSGYPDGRVYINMSGNSGMATAGSGDTLTGAIAAMFGLGLNFDEAVRTGVFIHGFSGDLAASDIGDDGITAQDILDYLPRAVKNYRENYTQIFENHYGTIYPV
jgi:NAD(P)H-hydrate epimerase